MSSGALLEWRSARADRSDRLRALSEPEQPLLTESLVLRLAAEFQGFARDLHDETLQAVLAEVSALRATVRLLRTPYVASRRLGRGNADPRALSDDFGLFGLALWPELADRYPHEGPEWRERLRTMLLARNGIAHDDVDQLQRVRAAGWELNRRSVDRWRMTPDGLAGGMDTVVAHYVARVFGTRPW